MKRLIFLLIIVAGGVAAYYSMRQPAGPLVLTGIVTTEDVIVAPQLGGQIGQLMVKEGDQVERNQLIAVMTTDELQADRAYYDRTVESMQSQVGENEAALRYEQRQTERRQRLQRPRPRKSRRRRSWKTLESSWSEPRNCRSRASLRFNSSIRRELHTMRQRPGSRQLRSRLKSSAPRSPWPTRTPSR